MRVHLQTCGQDERKPTRSGAASGVAAGRGPCHLQGRKGFLVRAVALGREMQCPSDCGLAGKKPDE